MLNTHNTLRINIDFIPNCKSTFLIGHAVFYHGKYPLALQVRLGTRMVSVGIMLIVQ